MLCILKYGVLIFLLKTGFLFVALKLVFLEVVIVLLLTFIENFMFIIGGHSK